MHDTDKERQADLEMKEARTTLDRLERGEWWRWATALIIMLVLTVGFFLLTITSPDSQRPSRLQGDELGLLALVIVFDLFVIYQRFMNGRLRRKLAMQIATVATLEAMRTTPTETTSDQTERRHWLRHKVDERVRVIVSEDGKDRHLYGRITDISENGIGAVIPDSLNLAAVVIVEFSLQKSGEFVMQAVVRHRRGFRYGFDFVDLPAATLQELKDALGTLVQV